ncbi:sensor histidine kinase [Blautia sp.]|uniref:sensor histidine kinase n=1 Tax=Blautia sp. TaxID=1955243 RepID=UPI002602D7D1|nr:HAMP domain-containing sensor histidine kinase [Blautia sp.]
MEARRGKPMIGTGKVLRRLNEMLDSALDGSFEEYHYDETELSKIETKWNRFLSSSSLARKNIEKEKANLQSLVSDISHQTKTPVANMKLYAELLEEGIARENPDREQMLFMAGEMKKQAERLEFLIQALTKMSRLETNLVVVQPEKQPVEPLIFQAVAQIRPKAEACEIDVKIQGNQKITACYDKKWSIEALYNLLDNAVKYSPRGSQVNLRVQEYSMYCEICVEDRGIGMTEEEIPKVFQRFYRGKQVQQKQGVGIGLYLVREIVKKQKGYVKIKSQPGQGSRISLFLPKD